MDTKSLEMVKGMLEAMASKLGVGASHLWGVLVKQAQVEAYAAVAGFGIWLVVITCLFFAAWRMNYKEGLRGAKGYDQLSHIPFIIGMILTVFGVLVFFLSFSGVVTGFVNPEYIAFTKLTSLVSSCR
jgi:hypothetical protein